MTQHLARQARAAADAAATRSGVSVVDVEDIVRLRAVSSLFVAVWGPSPEGAPLASDLMRSLVHAGGAVCAAYDATDELAGAAALVPTWPAGSTYSLIAAARPGGANRGVGFALKQHQRAWALERDLAAMTWTFDPLVSRNARFNLTKLGAEVGEYVEGFYGQMADEMNAGDDSDRLVAVWPLDSARTVACSEGSPAELAEPVGDADVRASGPDGGPVLIATSDRLWCRAPSDIVALRRQDPRAAAAWRRCLRELLAPLLNAGHRATGMTRNGWYEMMPPTLEGDGDAT